MEAKELRIGNKVIQGKRICDVASISGIKYSFNQQDVGLYYYNNKIERHLVGSLKPIPLTEEILFKCGFGKRFCTNPQEQNALIVYEIEKFEILKFEDESAFFFSNINGFHTNITSVHQLQNLYFALTGAELDISKIIEK